MVRVRRLTKNRRLTEEQIAENTWITGSTLNNWENSYMEILEALKRSIVIKVRP